MYAIKQYIYIYIHTYAHVHLPHFYRCIHSSASMNWSGSSRSLPAENLRRNSFNVQMTGEGYSGPEQSGGRRKAQQSARSSSVRGFPARKMGVPKFAGWFISWKIPSFAMDDDLGYPHDSGNHQMVKNGD